MMTYKVICLRFFTLKIKKVNKKELFLSPCYNVFVKPVVKYLFGHHTLSLTLQGVYLGSFCFLVASFKLLRVFRFSPSNHVMG